MSFSDFPTVVEWSLNMCLSHLARFLVVLVAMVTDVVNRVVER